MEYQVPYPDSNIILDFIRQIQKFSDHIVLQSIN